MEHSNDVHFAVSRILTQNHKKTMDYSLWSSAIFAKNVIEIKNLFKVTGSLHADTRAVYLIKRYFIVFLSPKIKPCDPTWTWKTVLR